MPLVNTALCKGGQLRDLDGIVWYDDMVGGGISGAMLQSCSSCQRDTPVEGLGKMR